MNTREVNMVCPINWLSPLNSGLLGWWLSLMGMDSGSRFRDLLGLYPGTLTNMDPVTDWLPNDRPGSLGRSLDFDGSNDLVVTSAKVPDNAPFTVACWFRHDVAGVDIIWSQNVAAMVALGYDSTRWLYNNNNHSVDARESWNFTRDALWHHLVLSEPNTENANDASLYIDGVALAHSGGVGDWNPGAANFIIGGRAVATAGWQGRIDDVRIWNRALSSFEVVAVYNDSRRWCQQALNRVRMPVLSGTVVAPGSVFGVTDRSTSLRISSGKRLTPLKRR